MPNVLNPKTAPDPYSGTYIICLKDDPSKVIEKKQITSKEEFSTILEEVFKYNNAFQNEGPNLRKLIKVEE